MTDLRVPDLSRVESPPPQPDLRYETVRDGEVIGSGGQAIVRRKVVPGSDSPDVVAVKEPQAPSQTLDQSTVESFFEEARTWQTLARRERDQQFRDTDHIVGVVAIGHDLPWVAMEYMDGGSLADRLDSHPDGLPVDEALWIAECLCKGLKLAHDHGVAHLDLKPENVLFRETPGDTYDVPKIADWGLARTLLEESGSMDAFSVEYAAPEQLDSDQFGTPDTYTDIYQVGAILYEMLTGDPPYTGGRASVMHDVLSGDDPTSVSSVREECLSGFDQVVKMALARSKTDRYEDIILFGRDIKQLYDKWTSNRPDEIKSSDTVGDTAAKDNSIEILQEVEGIGSVYAQRLVAADVECLEELAAIEPETLASDTSFSVDQLRHFKAVASRTTGTPLQELKGIGPTYEERLNKFGLGSVEDIAEANPSVIGEQLDIAPTKVEQWKRRASQTLGEEKGKIDEGTKADGDSVERTNDESPDPIDPDETAGAVPLKEIDGIGPVNAYRLESNGVSNVYELAETDSETIASEARYLSEERVSKWISQAQDYQDTQIRAIDGIGETYEERLNTLGIYTVQHLLEFSPEKVAVTLSTSEAEVSKWFDQAQLFDGIPPESNGPPIERVNGIGEKYGQRLRDLGIESADQLAATDPARVSSLIDVTESRVSDWIESAIDELRLKHINDITPEEERILHKNGIETPKDLLSIKPERLSKSTGIDRIRIKAWQWRVEEMIV